MDWSLVQAIGRPPLPFFDKPRWRPTPTPTPTPYHQAPSTMSTQPHPSASNPASFRYGASLVLVHWLMAALLVAVYASIELRVLYAKGTEMRDFMKALHFMLGLSVLAMVVLRLAARAASPKPAPQDDAKLPQLAASVGHWVLYALMVGMPVLGWLVLSTSGKPIPFFGLELPALMAPNKELAHTLKELHETAGVAGYWLIGLHVTAALGHHYLLKDGLLSRMALGKATA